MMNKWEQIAIVKQLLSTGPKTIHEIRASWPSGSDSLRKTLHLAGAVTNRWLWWLPQNVPAVQANTVKGYPQAAAPARQIALGKTNPQSETDPKSKHLHT